MAMMLGHPYTPSIVGGIASFGGAGILLLRYTDLAAGAVIAIAIAAALAISAAEKPSTSNSTSAARWLPGRCCSIATNASSTASRCSYRASGAVGPAPRPRSAYGSSQAVSAAGTSPITGCVLAGPRSTGRARRDRDPAALRQVRVATE